MPKVSVIIPAYNCGSFIERTILSVCNQTFKDWELIIVDDGSTDNTKEVVLSFQKKDSRIKCFFQENSGAPARPKNIGLQNATGEYIAFLDHDDEWLPHKLEKHIYFFENSNTKNLCLTFSGALIVALPSLEQREYKIPNYKHHTASLLERNYIFCSSGVVVKKGVFEKIGFFDENLRFGDDWDMWLRISKDFRLEAINEPLYKFYRHQNTMTSKTKEGIKIRDYEYDLKKHEKLFSNYPINFSRRLLSMGRICYTAGFYKKGIKYFVKSIHINPRNWKSYINMFFAILGPYCYKLFVDARKEYGQKQ